MSSSRSTSERLIGYFPLRQVSRPNTRSVPKSRWIYKYRSHAIAVLQEAVERGPGNVEFMAPLVGFLEAVGQAALAGNNKTRPWLLRVEVPPGTPLAEVLKKHRFGPLPEQSFDEVFPAYYLMQRASVLETIDVAQDDEWLATQVQRKLLKTAGSAG
jgi:hypothetical protein